MSVPSQNARENKSLPFLYSLSWLAVRANNPLNPYRCDLNAVAISLGHEPEIILLPRKYCLSMGTQFNNLFIESALGKSP